MGPVSLHQHLSEKLRNKKDKFQKWKKGHIIEQNIRKWPKSARLGSGKICLSMN